MHCHKHAIDIDNLSYTYEDGTRALNEVELHIHHGHRVALLGPNGAGKSTLIAHLNGITLPQTGSVSIEDRAMTEKSAPELRQIVGVVFQDPDDMLFMTSIEDDIAFGPLHAGLTADQVAQRTQTALDAVALNDVRNKPGMHLSFGQKKRAALASVLSMEPRVLILDEPTSNLDPRSRRSMIELIDSLDITLIIATHDMDLAWEMCDHALVLDQGRIVAQGPAQEIMTDEALMTAHGLEVPLLAKI